MVSNAADGSVRLPGEWADLELTVRRLLDEYAEVQRRAEQAETRALELEASLREVSSGAVDPVELRRRSEALERENRDLRGRLDQARERVVRVMDRLRFAEESR